MSDTILSFDEVLSRLGLEAEALNHLVASEDLRAVVQGRDLVFRESEVERYLGGGIPASPAVGVGNVESAKSRPTGEEDLALEIGTGELEPVEDFAPPASAVKEELEFAPPPAGDFGEDLSLDMDDFSDGPELSEPELELEPEPLPEPEPEPEPVAAQPVFSSAPQVAMISDPMNSGDDDLDFSLDVDDISLDGDAAGITDATLDLPEEPRLDTRATMGEDLSVDLDMDDTAPTQAAEREVGLETEEIVFDDDDLAIGGLDEDTSIGTQDMTVQEDAIDLDASDAGLTLMDEDAVDATQAVDDGDLTVAVEDDFAETGTKAKGKGKGKKAVFLRSQAHSQDSGTSARRTRGTITRPEPVSGLLWSFIMTGAAIAAIVPFTIFFAIGSKGHTTGTDSFKASRFSDGALPEYGHSFQPYHLSELIKSTDAGNVFGSFDDVKRSRIRQDALPVDPLRPAPTAAPASAPVGEDMPFDAGVQSVPAEDTPVVETPVESSAEEVHDEPATEGGVDAPAGEGAADDPIGVAEEPAGG